MEMINQNESMLYVNVYCYSCQKTMTMFDAITFGGRYYCNNCSPYNTDSLFDLIHQCSRESSYEQ